MMVLSMDSNKRQRGQNVRLGEVGDVSAAFACGVLQNVKKDFHWEKGLDYGFLIPEESEYNYISGFCQERVSSEFDDSDPGLSPWFSVDLLHNRENTNPNSMNFVSEFDILDEMIKPELEFETLGQKRVLANKGRRSKRCKRTAFGDYWKSEVISQANTEDEGENEYRRKEVTGFVSNPCSNVYVTHSPGHETFATSKEACKADAYEPTFNIQNGGYSSEFRKEGENSLSSDSFSRYDTLEVCGSDVISVGRWLEDLGYGKYVGLFERHEVDEEALHLLTLDDLKEMGVVAAGPRRKLYTAIRQLRHSREHLSNLNN